MKKLLLTFMALVLVTMSTFATQVEVTMNAKSKLIKSLVNMATNEPVEVGEPTSNKYTFEAADGSYLLTATAADGETVSGTIQLDIDADHTTFAIFSPEITVKNTGWVYGTDYTFNLKVTTKEGAVVNTTMGDYTTGKKMFLVFNGNTYYLDMVPSEARQTEGYLTASYTGTVTYNASVNAEAPMSYAYNVTVPAEATFFLGTKIAHFVKFKEVAAKEVKTEGGNKVYSFILADKLQYNYRVSQPGKYTQAGTFTMSGDEAKRPTLIFTDADLSAKNPKFIDHDVTSNGGYNVGDLFLNINAAGHLKLAKVGDTYDILPMRNWELTNSVTGNYFIEPDFHFTVVNLNGQADNSVVKVENELLTAVGTGTAIVLVTYDAIHVNEYSEATKNGFVGGADWGAIWPENTGAFVVTVGENATGITPNITINENYLTQANGVDTKIAMENVDAEFDVLYYLDTEDGFDYTFTPEGAASVTLARPTIGTNTASYTGFSAEGVTKNADNSYTVHLTMGRNIVCLTDAAGKSIYQVITAKPCHREIKNVTRKGSLTYIPGDEVTIQYSGLYHPANKLAGIHNFSGFVSYKKYSEGLTVKNGKGNQYTMASNAEAQAVTFTVPETWEGSTIELYDGVMSLSGFGDPVGNHRATSKDTGRAPNFTAISQSASLGRVPGVKLSVKEAKQFVIRLQCEQEDVNYTLTRNGKAVTLNGDGTYTGTYGDYALTASKVGYRCYRHTYTIGDDAEGEQTFNVTLTAADATTWDGETKTEPTAVESVYQIGTGAELAWFANTVNGGQYATKAVLTADIDLGDYAWTPIGGTTTAKAYQGIFDGKGHTISGLYINNEAATYQGLFAYLKDATVSGVTVEGEITGKQYVGGIAANMGANAVIDRCVNKAKITGVGTYVGGITGYVSVATAKVTNSYNTGDVTGTTNCGGVAGSNNATAVIENIFNLGNVKGTTVGACVGGTTKKDNMKNAFATKEYGIITGQTTVTDAQMKSGYVAHLLGEAFGQTLGTDNYPVLDGKKVYLVYYTTSLSDADVVSSLYTNGTLPEFEPVSGLYPTWLTAVDGEPVTEVTADATLYVNYAPIIVEEKVADFEDIEIGEEGHMSVSTEEDDERTEFTSGTYKFYTGCMSDWDYWYWFGYANQTDNTYASLDDQWKNAVGGGYNNSANYGVAYAAAFNGPCYVDVLHNSTGAVVPGFYVTNSAYAYTSMLNGDGFAKKFGKGDWFKLTITGYDAAGEVTGTKDFYLADLRDPSKAYIINDWRYVDLSGLGKVSKLGFALSSTDNGEYGMNTPAYFCFDNFGAAGEETLPEKNVELALDVATFEDIEIGAEGHMSVSTEEDDERTEFTSGDFKFATGCMSEWATWWYFGYANSTATKYESLDNQWNNIVGGGYDNSANYGVAYASSYYGPCNVTVLNHDGGIVVPGFYITNSAYAYSSMLNGDAYAKKFVKGDWFKLTITGYDAAGEVTGTKEFYLADLRDEAKAYIINDWRYVDLSGLGKVCKLGFALSSTDNGDWGMNTPAYFCFDNFGAEGTETLPEKNVEVETAISNFSVAKQPATYFNLKGENMSTLQKGVNIVRMPDGSVRKIVVK